MSIAGHVSRKILEHYSHIRQDAKRETVNIFSRKAPQRHRSESYGTNQVSSELASPYVVDFFDGDPRAATNSPPRYRPFTAITRVRIPSGTPNRICDLEKPSGFDVGTHGHKNAPHLRCGASQTLSLCGDSRGVRGHKWLQLLRTNASSFVSQCRPGAAQPSSEPVASCRRSLECTCPVSP